MNNTKIAILFLIQILFTQNLHAYQLSPTGTKKEREHAKQWGVFIKAKIVVTEKALHNFASPVHETITQLSFGCSNDWSDCDDADLEDAGPYVMAGVRWNDDPPFKLVLGEGKGLDCSRDAVSFITQTKCWIGLFKDAEKRVSENPEFFLVPSHGNYMSRSHFGDLQFLHSMATQNNESPQETKNNILMWAEFIWKIQNGEIKLSTKLKNIDIYNWKYHFANNHDVQDLFTLGRPWLRGNIKDVAFGSLLHLIQDSFASGHVNRLEPRFGTYCLNNSHKTYGPIREFHSYTSQDHRKHKEADSEVSAKQDLSLDPDVVDAGKKLVSLRQQEADWEKVREFLDQCLFVIDNDAIPASPGDGFMKEL